MATQYANGQIVTNGLVLALNAADRNSYVSGSTIWNDISGNNNSGSLVNGPTFNSGSGGSIVFDGTDDRVDCGTANIIPNSWTLSCWIQHTKTTGTSGLIARSGGAPNYDQNAILGWASTLNSRFYISGKTTTSVYVSTTSSFSPNTSSFYNVVGCFDTSNTTLYLYINGVLDSTKNIGATFTTGSNLVTQIGSTDGTSQPGNFAKGNIASAQIYNRALSATEILQNYNAQKSRFNL